MGNQMLVLFLAFLAWVCHGIPTGAPACKAKERQALMELKAGLRDPSGRLSSWAGKDCCTWSGVACNNQTSHVIRLNLRNPYDSDESMNTVLEGEINPSLVQLGHLRYLDLSNNDFRGVQVPPFIGTFKQLRYLNLSWSGLSGTVPHQLGNLSSLRSLDLSYNDYCIRRLVVDGIYIRFRRCPPDFSNTHRLVVDGSHWLSQLSSLQYLDLSFVNLGKASNCLQALSTLPSLREIHLVDCQLGTIPLSLPHVNFTSLSFLDVSDNTISSKMPNWLFNLTGLEFLYLQGNQFQGLLSDAIGNMTSLKELDLSIYEDGPQIRIPETLQKLCRLRTLNLYGWNLSNSLDGLGRILSGCIRNSLSKLDLSGTLIGGSQPNLPPWLFKLTSLRYLGISINGSIPTAIGNLTLLESLYLSGSNLEGSLPLTLGKLCRLRSLYLFSCNITGKLDDFGGIFSGCIGNSLTELDMSSNLLNGVLPQWLFNLKSLKYLDLSQNAIHGSIPASVERLSSLGILDLSDNMLNGTISENLGKLSELLFLYLGKNSLEGILSEAHFVDLTKLKSLGLSFNNLTIDVSSDWQPPFQLINIILRSCQVGPKFPAWILKQEALQWVDLSHAKISGSVPDQFWNLTSNMAFLVLSNNNLSGSIPLSGLEAMSNLEFLDLSSNFFSGPLPSFFGPSPQGLVKKQFPLRYLFLSMNNINGTLSSNLCELENLEILVLSNNQISGEIPGCLLQSSTLTILDISSNKISGMIPNSTSSASSLEQLHLNNNSLSGELPYFLQSCQSMVILDLGHNKLSGKIPSWVGEGLSSLRILSLRSNLFNGELPQTLHQLTTLQVLDLSYNHLSGIIPRSFGNFTAMKYVNMNMNGWNSSDMSHNYYVAGIFLEIKGRDLFFDRTLALVVAMDLSNNYLFGTIPRDLENLHGLQSLNLSRNHLTGRITNKIGKLRQLESLDLSKNQLSGVLPQSLSCLSFLESLNLSYNNFSGRIPHGGQLDTFVDPSIYVGNHDLCGFPLSNDCMRNGNMNKILDYAKAEEDEMLWFYLGIMAGFALGFWGVWGILLIKRSWRYSYYQSIDKFYVGIRIKFGKLK